jgi:hypothetical protein
MKGRDSIPDGDKMFLSRIAFRWALGQAPASTEWVLRVKGPTRETDYSASSDIKNGGAKPPLPSTS